MYYTLPDRQGKASYLLALRDYLNTREESCAVYANIEAGQAYRNDTRAVEGIVCVEIVERAQQIRKEEVTGGLIANYLKA